MSQRLRHVPFDMVRRQMVLLPHSWHILYTTLSSQAAGTASSSFVSTLLSQLPLDEDLEHSRQAGLIRDTAAVMYGAAMDSVSFEISMCLYARLIDQGRLFYVYVLWCHGFAT